MDYQTYSVWEAKVQNRKVGSCRGENFLQVDLCIFAVSFEPKDVVCICYVLTQFHIVVRHLNDKC